MEFVGITLYVWIILLCVSFARSHCTRGVNKSTYHIFFDIVLWPRPVADGGNKSVDLYADSSKYCATAFLGSY